MSDWCLAYLMWCTSWYNKRNLRQSKLQHMHRMRFSVHTCAGGMNYVLNENKTFKPRRNICEHTIPLLLGMGINVEPYLISEINRLTPLGTPP
jgi:hypothetical protein